MAKTKLTSSDKINLAVTKREIFGKKLKALRKSGLVPANVFGAAFKSEAISVQLKEFIHAYRIARETGIIYLTGLKEELPVLVASVQKHPVNDLLVHVDFRSVDLKKKIETAVPILLVGQSEAASQKGGVVLHLAKALKVEALPQDIPHEISVDISVIKDIGQEVRVSDLQTSTKYEIKEVKEMVIASVVAHKEESVTPEITAAVAPEVITAKPDEEGTNLVTPAAPGDKKAETAPDSKAEEKK